MSRSRLDLKSGWTFRQRDDESQSAWLPVKEVPSQVHLDLLANKKIPDPFVDTNELAVRWIAEKDWIYRLQFQVPAASEPNVTTDLVFEGLDTFATVTLNGTEILKAENMHVSYRVEVTKALSDGENILEIVFDSARLRGKELVESHPEHKHWARQTEDTRIPVRKAQYNWGWDWGPILNTAGPWRPVYLEQYVSRVDDVWAQYTLDSDLKSCTGLVFARVGDATGSDDKLVLSVSRDGKTAFEQTCSIGPDGIAEAAFTIEDVALWNPFGYGAQHRYELSARIVRGDVSLDSVTKRIGFRRVELIQEPDSWGKSFYFRINGVDVFAGGSCWIPADSFLAQISPERYWDWMRLMVEGNQIMIRVWGGGIYEDNAFLDACDALGVLVWQDFAFACGNYPAYPSYLKNVELEVRQNIRRFRSHPSVIIWAGNNEDYQVLERYKLEYDYENKDPESWLKTTFPARYMYEYLFPKLVGEEDPGALYHPGSPWGDGKNSADPTVGDIHQWNIWHGAMNRYQECDQLSGRFISEFGMEAYPHLETIYRMITPPQQHHPGSLMMDFRNKAIDHERRLMTYVAENFQVRYDLPSFTHLSQIVQAESMRFAYKTWRREWGQPGARQCGGVLVWQLNDCWPTMSWAVVDYYLIKKPGYYAIANALRPLDVGIARNCPDWTSGHADPRLFRKTDFEIWVASSRIEAVNAQLSVRFISVKSGQDIREPIFRGVVANPNSTTEVVQDQHVMEGNEDGTNWELHDPFVIYASLKVDDEVVATDTAWPHPLKYLDFSDRGVQVEISPSKTEIKVSARLPVKGFVISEREGLKLSDNGFDLVPGEIHTVRVDGDLGVVDQLTWTYVGGP